MKYFFGENFNFSSLLMSDIAIDIETTGLELSSEIYSIGFSNEYGGVVYVLDVDNFEEIKMLLRATLLNHNFDYTVVFHNGLFDIPFILRIFFGEIRSLSSLLFCKKLFDTVIAARFIYSTQYLSHLDIHKRLTYSLKYLAEYYGVNMDEVYSFEDAITGLKIDFANPDNVANYNYKDCVNTLGLFKKFKSLLLHSDQYNYFNSYHFPHAFWNIFHMRWNGIPVDEGQVNEKIDLVNQFIEELLGKIYARTKCLFNLSSQEELASAIFYNHFLRDDDGEMFKPPFITEKGSRKVDISTFKYLRNHSQKIENVELFDNIIAVMEASSVLRELNAISENLVLTDKGYYIFANQTVSAKSGRIRISKPNVHGQSKKGFKATNWESVKDGNSKYEFLKSFSTRHLYTQWPEYWVLSMDANSIDLKVLAQMATISSWEKIFDLKLDNHFEILRKGNPSFFSSIFKRFGGRSISGIKELVKSKNDNSYQLITTEEVFDLEKNIFDELNNKRDTAKQTNLGIPYMLGAKSLAEKIYEATGDPLTVGSAKEMLENYYENFPEIRSHHDLFALHLFKNGYFHPMIDNKNFGMRFHSNTWYSLNTHREVSDQNYELILYFRGHYFYLSLDSWLQENSTSDGVVSIDLKPFLNPFPLFFKKARLIKQLSGSIFAVKLKTKRSKRRRNEDVSEEESDFEIGSIDRTYLIRQEICDVDNELNEIELDLLRELSCGSMIKIPSTLIKYYCDTVPATQNYFKLFKDLFAETKKLFPSYVQGVSAVCVGRVLTNIRLEFEKRELKSYIFLSVHDSIDILVHVSEVEVVEEIIRNEKILETFIPVTWKYDEPSEHWN